MAEGTPLERVQVVNSGARVQIPLSPFLFTNRIGKRNQRFLITTFRLMKEKIFWKIIEKSCWQTRNDMIYSISLLRQTSLRQHKEPWQINSNATLKIQETGFTARSAAQLAERHSQACLRRGVMAGASNAKHWETVRERETSSRAWYRELFREYRTDTT